MVTRDDVARRAGVSTAVVSYVVNGGPRRVAPATRDRVLRAIEALGYRPDGIARALRRGSSDTLGLVVPDITNPFFSELADAVEREASRHGHALLVGSAGEDEGAQRRYMLGLAERRIDGLLVVSTLSDEVIGPLADLAIPVVALDRPPDGSPISSVRIDNAAGAGEAARHLIGHHRRRMALVNGPEDSGVANARRDGWAAALAASGLRGRVMVAPYTASGGREAMGAILDAEPSIEAVLVASDIQALGVLRALTDRGVRCPEDVAVISIDGTALGEYAAVPLTTIAQPITEMAALAVAHICAEGPSVLNAVVRHNLVLRRSCGCG